jgi:phage-related baseplate assembly protein
VGAYKFHAQSADPTIVDVAITSPVPGTVNIYPLVEGAVVTPAPVLSAVQAKCSDEKVRPLTDTVQVLSPTITNYTITVQLTLYTWADQTSVEDQVDENLSAFTLEKQKQLGRDIVLNQIIAQCMVEGVYSVSVVSPVADIVIAPTAVGKCTAINVSTVALTNG